MDRSYHTTVVGSLGMVVGSRKMPRDAPAVPRLPWGAQSAPGPENPLKTRLVSIHRWPADSWVPIGGALWGGCLRLTAGLSAERPSLGGLFGPARASMLIAALPTRRPMTFLLCPA